MNKKHTFEYVKQYFKDQSCELSEKEYKNNFTKMEYRCSCGNISKIKYSHFKNGHKCMKCGAEKRAKERRIPFECVKNYFKEQRCELLEKEYINNSVKMKYKCSCGNINKINFSNFQLGQRCRKCSGCEKLTYKYIFNYFKKNGCELLEKEYKNNRTPMEYKCICKKKSKITFNNFKNGQRCKKCGILKNSVENNYNYNPNLTDEDRKRNKTRHKEYAYKKWRQKVFKKDGYVCKKCFKKGLYLNAHHIESWSNNKKLRLTISNGITFCKKCHNQFHKIYGKGKNDRQQLNDFLNTNRLRVG